MKLYCEKCYKPVFSTVAKAMAFWKIIRRAYPKDWADAITAAKNAAKRCQKCKDDEGRTS
jgi:hypothetical protein